MFGLLQQALLKRGNMRKADCGLDATAWLIIVIAVRKAVKTIWEEVADSLEQKPGDESNALLCSQRLKLNKEA